MALDCFFAVWFVVGNVWIFGGHTSPSDAPQLYRYLKLTVIVQPEFYILEPLNNLGNFMQVMYCISYL